MHQLLRMEKIRLEGGHGTAEEAREVAVGVTTALALNPPPEMWLRFALRASVDELAAVLADQVFDTPAPAAGS